jgi:hypothetical protein
MLCKIARFAATNSSQAHQMDPTELAKDKIIAKRRDVLLQPSINSKPVGTLLVSPQILRLVSPVFEAMFNGNFEDGQDLSVASPRNVAMSDDDPEALALLCMITHMHLGDIPNQVSFDKLADFTVLCDKYQCTTAVRFWSKMQTTQLLSNPHAPMFEKLMFVTCVLDLHIEFEQVTLRMIRDCYGTFS